MSGGDVPLSEPAEDYVPLLGITRDFHVNNGSFGAESAGSSEPTPGLVDSRLSADKRPIFVGGDGDGNIADPASFRSFFQDTPNVNQSTLTPFLFKQTSADPYNPYYEFTSSSFFSVDGELFGNEGSSDSHNHNFTLELRANFNFRGSENLSVSSTDDLWVFINDRLAIDLGGIHGLASATVDLSEQMVRDRLGIEQGEEYSVDFFYANRTNAGAAQLSIGTELALLPNFVVNPSEGELDGWTVSEAGGSANGHGTVTAVEGGVVLEEGDSFLLGVQKTGAIPSAAKLLLIDYTASFDTTNSSAMRDALEFSLVDASGRSVLGPFAADTQSAFNLAESVGWRKGADTIVDGNTVAFNLVNAPRQREVTVRAQLINNDDDHESTATIFNTCAPSLDLELENDTAPSGLGTEGYLTDLLTNDPTLRLTVSSARGVRLAQIQIDDGSFIDVTDDMVNNSVVYDPGLLAAGEHTARARVYDGLGIAGEATLTFTVNAAPLADAGGDRTVKLGGQLSFDGTDSTDPEDGLYSYQWVFSDDESTASTANPFHQFLTPGQYTVTLTVTDSAGSTDTDTINIDVSATKFFVVDRAVNMIFDYSDDGDYQRQGELDGANSTPTGIVSNIDGSRRWVMDSNGGVYVYDADGVLIGSWIANDIDDSQDIATDGTDIFIVDRGLESVLRYEGAASFTSGVHSADSTFSLDASNESPTGIVVASHESSTYLYVTDDEVDAVFVYSLSGSLARSWTLDGANADASGLTANPAGGEDLWVVDRDDAVVYHYATGVTFAGSNNTADDSFALFEGNVGESLDGNLAPEGIADPPTLIVDPVPATSVIPGSVIVVTGRAIDEDGVPVAVSINGSAVDAIDADGNFFSRVVVPDRDFSLNVSAFQAPTETATETVTLVPVPSNQIDFNNLVNQTPSLSPVYGATSFDSQSDILSAEMKITNSGIYDQRSSLLMGIKNISDPSVRVDRADGLTPDGTPYFDFTSLVENEILQPEEVTGERIIRFYNPGHVSFTYDLVFLGDINRAPTFTTTPIAQVSAGSEYEYAVGASDVNGDPLTISLVAGPAGMTLDSNNRLHWEPTSATVPPFFSATNNRIDFNNWEYIVSASSSTELSVGDIVHGVFQAQDLALGPAGQVLRDLLDEGSPSLTGIFEAEVQDIVVTSGLISEIVFGPSGSGWQEALDLPAGTMFAVYSDENQDFDPTLATEAAVEAAITDGALLGAFGFSGTTGTFADGFWISSPILDPTPPLHPPGSTQIFYGLHLLGGALASADVHLRTQVNPYIGDISELDLVQEEIWTAELPFDFVGRSELVELTTGIYDTFSQDPALIWVDSGVDTGNQVVIIKVTDPHGGETFQRFVISVVDPPDNGPPYFTSTPILEAFVGEEYVYQSTAADPDFDFLTFSQLIDESDPIPIPDSLEISSEGLVTWVPTASDLLDEEGNLLASKLFQVTIEVDDGHEHTALQHYHILVRPGPLNHPPIITSEPYTEMRHYIPVPNDAIFTVPGELGDTVDITFTKTFIESGFSANSEFGLLKVSDAQGRVDGFVPNTSGHYDWNHLPGDTNDGSRVPIFQFSPSSNPATRTVTLQCGDAYAFYFGFATAYFTQWVFSFTAANGGTSPGQSFLASYDNDNLVLSFDLLNFGPEHKFDCVLDVKLDAGFRDEFVYPVRAFDEDEDILTYSLINAPTGASIDSQTGVLRWSPTSATNGEGVPFTVKATDGRGGADSQTFTVEVLDTGLAEIRGAKYSDVNQDGERPALTSSVDAGEINLVAISTTFNSPIGIDYHEPTNSVIISANYSTGGIPYNFERIDSNGTHTAFSSVTGLTEEIKVATVKSGNRTRFQVGDVFAGNGVDGQIIRITNSGQTVINPWVDLPGCANGLLRGSLYIDETGVFDGDLIAVTTTGEVWRIDEFKTMTKLADLNTHLEGAITVPNDVIHYGPLAGKIIAGAEDEGKLYAISPRACFTTSFSARKARHDGKANGF